MFEKIKAGSIELIKPDKDCLKLLASLISQNEKVLDMNTQMIAALLTPVITETTTLGGDVHVEPFPGSPADVLREEKRKRGK